MTEAQRKDLEKIYLQAIEALDQVMEMQRTIASKQIDILTKLRRLHNQGFIKISDDIAVKHVVKFMPGRCEKCGVLIEGVYEYLRSQRDTNLCVGCDGSDKVKEDRK